jgi:transposase
MRLSYIGLDTAKNVFQVRGIDERGHARLEKRLRRGQITDFFSNVPPCTIGLEATRGAHYWARVLSTFGHTVQLIAPQFVKPYLKSQKNDANDAAAICEAVSRPHMRFIPPKTIEQQDLQAMHRIRSRLIGCRTQLGNQIRGLLAEYGIVLPQHLGHLRQAWPQLNDERETRLSGVAKRLIADLYDDLNALDERIEGMDQQLEHVYRTNPLCQRISAIEGVGPITATAVVAAIGNASSFNSGRQLAAWLGLVPRQYSSGDKQRLLSITKRGDPYIRMLLIHGARSVVFRAGLKSDSRSQWIADKQKRLGTSKASVALANKNARIIWAVLAKDEPYRRAAA